MTNRQDRQVYRCPVHSDRDQTLPFFYTDLYSRFCAPFADAANSRQHDLIIEVLWDTNEYIREMGNNIRASAVTP